MKFAEYVATEFSFVGLSTVNLAKKFYNRRDMEFFLGDYF